MAESGRIVTYRELDERSNRLAHLLRDRGLRRGDHIAILAENHERFFDALWAAARSGHTGGVNAAMADGSVRFFSNTVTQPVWSALGTRSGGEAVGQEF